MRKTWTRCLLSTAVLGYLFLPTMTVIAQGTPSSLRANASEQKDSYRLGPLDKMIIKVYEWRASRDEVYEWPVFKAEHRVDASGNLSLPLVGSVAAEGLTTQDLAREIGDRLQKRMGLIEIPDISIELVEFRPFYIVGAVDRPGEFPFRPGLTVLKAYAIAGGKPRNSLGLVRLEREAIATRGDLDAYELEAQTLLLRLARLQAEMNEAQSIVWPADLQSRVESGALKRVAHQERTVFDSRNEAFHTQLNALEQLQNYLDKEVNSLEKQLEVHSAEVESVKTESELIANLYKKGLAVASRKLALDRNVAQVDGDRLRLESSLMRARQEVSRTKISIIDLRAKRSSDISGEMQTAQQRLEELRSRTETARNLLFETENLAPQILASQDKAQGVRPTFKIMRGDRVLEGNDVTETTALQPGDTLVVEAERRAELPELSESGAAAETSSASASDMAGWLR